MITFRKNAADRGEILLYDTVGRSPWSDEGMSDKDFIEKLDELGPVRSIDLRVNSEGGRIQDGLAIYNALKRHPAEKTGHVDGLAASTAGWVLMACDTINMAENSMLMVHDPQSGVCGSAADMRREAEVLDKLRDTIAGMFASRSGKPIDTFIAAMNAETWYDANQALAAGLCTAVVANKTAPENTANLARFNLARFKNPPAILKARVDLARVLTRNINARRRLDLASKETCASGAD